MFSLISTAVDFVLGKVFVKDYDEEQEEETKPTILTLFENYEEFYGSEGDQQDVLLTALLDEREKFSEAQTVSRTGKVTQVFHGHGLIDGEVYFAADAVTSANPVQVQCTVNLNKTYIHCWLTGLVVLFLSCFLYPLSFLL